MIRGENWSRKSLFLFNGENWSQKTEIREALSSVKFEKMYPEKFKDDIGRSIFITSSREICNNKQCFPRHAPHQSRRQGVAKIENEEEIEIEAQVQVR